MVLFFLLPVAFAVILGILGSIGVFRGLDGRAFDRLCALRSPAAVPGNILLLDIDMQAGSLAGFLADGLVTLKEMDARYAVLDLPLAQKSPPALDAAALRQTLPNALDREFSQMQENIQSLFDAIRRGSVRPRDSARYIADLVGLVGTAKGRLFGAAMGIERDDDVLLGQAAAFFGRVYVPAGLLGPVDLPSPPDLVDLALQRQSIPVLVTGLDPSFRASGLRPSVLPLVRGSHGGGFPSDEADSDGVRRRTRLLADVGGQHIGQLAFAALLDLLGNPAVEASPGRLLLRGAVLPGGTSVDRAIPLDESGEMLLTWPRAFPDDGFRHLPWSTLVQTKRLEDSLVADLRDLDAKGYLTYLRSTDSLLDVYEEGARLVRGMLAAGGDSEAGAWRAAREQFFSLCGQFLGGDAEARITADADRKLQGGTLSEEEKAVIRAERDRVPAAFEDARQVFARLQAVRASLRNSLAGSFCIVSQEQQEASRPGLTPFETAATDARASAALVSTIVSGRFLRDAPPRAALPAAVALSLLLSLAVVRMKPLLALVTGAAAAAAAAAVLGLVFTMYGFFMPPAIPFVSLLATAVALASLKLAWKRGASRTVRAAFSGRVSVEGLQQIDSTRAHLAPDGSRRQVTVLCLSEKGVPVRGPGDDPREVIRRLRTERAAVREAILGLGGMLGGTGGGRSTAYFGAPVETADHARRACLSALRVRALEHVLDDAAAPVSGSRIGVDTGECVAGFLGSRGIPEYSLIGPPADLAATLEGLNAGFGTSIIVTEAVRDAAGPGFQVRTLGLLPVRQERIRVYELCAEKGTGDSLPDGLIAEFEEGLARYERSDVTGALAIFARVLAAAPGDGPAAVYARHCRRLAAQGETPDLTSPPW